MNLLEKLDLSTRSKPVMQENQGSVTKPVFIEKIKIDNIDDFNFLVSFLRDMGYDFNSRKAQLKKYDTIKGNIRMDESFDISFPLYLYVTLEESDDYYFTDLLYTCNKVPSNPIDGTKLVRDLKIKSLNES